MGLDRLWGRKKDEEAGAEERERRRHTEKRIDGGRQRERQTQTVIRK